MMAEKSRSQKANTGGVENSDSHSKANVLVPITRFSITPSPEHIKWASATGEPVAQPTIIVS